MVYVLCKTQHTSVPEAFISTAYSVTATRETAAECDEYEVMGNLARDCTRGRLLEGWMIKL